MCTTEDLSHVSLISLDESLESRRCLAIDAMSVSTPHAKPTFEPITAPYLFASPHLIFLGGPP